jgi:hypothetical protein
MEGILAISIPIVLVVVTGSVFWAMFRYRAQVKTESQQTIRVMIEKGVELTPDLINRLGEPEPHKNKDLRLSLIWFAVGVALVVCGFLIPEEDALRICLSGAAFPLCLGVAYIIMWRLGTKVEEAESFDR